MEASGQLLFDGNQQSSLRKGTELVKNQSDLLFLRSHIYNDFYDFEILNVAWVDFGLVQYKELLLWLVIL